MIESVVLIAPIALGIILDRVRGLVSIQTEGIAALPCDWTQMNHVSHCIWPTSRHWRAKRSL